MFEQATRMKLRFATNIGTISVEDLWQLSLPTLDIIAKGLSKQIKEEETSFIADKTNVSELLELRFNIVKHIIDVKLADKAAMEKVVKDAERRKLLLGLLENKQQEELKELSKEDLLKELEALG